MLRAFLVPSFLVPFLCAAFAAQAQDAGALRTRHAILQKQLAENPFGRPLHVDSSVDGGKHRGQIFAVIERPYRVVAPALAQSPGWCDVLTLQVNIKGCKASDEGLTAFITRKPRDTVDSAHRVDFRFEPAPSGREYMRVRLSAAAGPVGTRNYEIVLQAAPLDPRRTLIDMSYAYTLGSMARAAMSAYLAGAGGEKPGFTVDGGERGVIERGAMRYYLAIEAYLTSPDNLDTRLHHWYTATTRYPQLRERVGLEEYVAMKRREAAG
jgi:hypothetical protein